MKGTASDLCVHLRERRRVPPALWSDVQARQYSAGNYLEASIGREVRAYRTKLGMTLVELARAAGLSLGMMSKIENGIISASLSTLQALSQALGIPLTSLLRPFEDFQQKALFVRSGMGVHMEHGDTRVGHHHDLLGYIEDGSNDVVMEPYLVTLARATDKVPLLRHAGMEFLHLLDGEMTFRHGSDLYHLLPGDSLSFDAETVHGPDRLTKLPIRFLSIVSCRRNGR